MPLPYRFLRRLVWVLFRALTQLDVTGLEHIPETGALIVAPNHIFILDVALVFAVIPRRLVAFAAEKWQGTPAGWLLQAVANAIFVSRGEVDRRALTCALAVLRAGGALGVAPEGTRSRSAGLIEGKDGLAYLASRSDAAILLVATWGQEQVFHCWRRLRRPVIHVRIGEPFRLPPEAAQARAVDLGAYTDQIMLTLARMLPAEYRGVYAGRV